jgi:hypothetical protein
MDKIVIACTTLNHLVVKIFGVLASMDKNNELLLVHGIDDPGIGSFGKYRHFELVNDYLQEYFLILTCSFLAEYRKEFTEKNCPELAPKIRVFRYKIKPVLKRIAQWKGMENYRNRILAHNFRLLNGVSIFDKASGKETYHLPVEYDEFVLLGELLALITTNMGIEFPELLEKLNWTETIADKYEVVSQPVEIFKELKLVHEQIRQRGLTHTDRARF